MRLGQEEQLLPAVAQAQAGHPARADADQRLGNLVSDVAPEGPGIQEGQHAPHAKGRRDNELPAGRRRHQHGQDQVAGAGTGDEQQPQRHRAEDRGRAQIGLLEQQAHHHAGHQQRRQKAHREDPDLLRLARQQRRQVDAQRQLGQLPRLERQRTQAKPADGAARARTDLQHHRQRQDREPQQGIGQPPVDRVVGPHRDRHRAQADHGVTDLALEEIGRVAVLARGEDRARREDHDHAERHQQQDGADQHAIGADLAGADQALIAEQPAPPLAETRGEMGEGRVSRRALRDRLDPGRRSHTRAGGGHQRAPPGAGPVATAACTAARNASARCW